MKKSKPNYLKYKLTILVTSIIIISYGCSVIENIPDYSDQEIRQQLSTREQKIQNLKRLEAQAAIHLQTTKQSGSLYAHLAFLTLDTLQIQFRDPLGRKMAKLDLFNNEYDLWLQRRRQHYSGRDLPDDYAATVFGRLTPREARQLLLGVSNFSPDNPVQNDTIRSHSINDLNVCIILYQHSPRIKEIQFRNANRKVLLSVFYQNYRSSDGLALPTDVWIRATEIPFVLRMRLSSFSAKFHKLS